MLAYFALRLSATFLMFSWSFSWLIGGILVRVRAAIARVAVIVRAVLKAFKTLVLVLTSD